MAPIKVAQRLASGEILLVLSPFRPVPLTDALARAGFCCFVREAAPGRFETFVTRGDRPLAGA
jgi:hypothetical protein